MNHQALQTWKGLQAIPENITPLFCSGRKGWGLNSTPVLSCHQWWAQGLSDTPGLPAAEKAQARQTQPGRSEPLAPTGTLLSELGLGPNSIVKGRSEDLIDFLQQSRAQS